ncbi:MAG: hypothetical protein ABIT38_09730 [Gemmatimonadaceae bacterium]
MTYRDDETGPTHPLPTVIGKLPSGVVRQVRLKLLSPAGVRSLALDAGRSDRG